jgi:hypothetical protein
MSVKITISNIDKPILEKLVKESKTWTEVLLYFKKNHGYKNITVNRTVKNRCIKEKIDFSHFKNYDVTKVNNFVATISINSMHIKNKLLKTDNSCYICKLKPSEENPVVLHLDHINGIHNDNNPANLRILCPNCHSQTNTYCRSSRKEDEYIEEEKEDENEYIEEEKEEEKDEYDNEEEENDEKDVQLNIYTKSIIDKIDLEIFKILIKDSHTWAEVNNYLRENYDYKCIYNNSILKRRCLRENIDTSHFVKNGCLNNVISIDKLLVKDSGPYSTTTIKKRLISENLVDEKCSSCNIDPIWTGKHLSLHLEHIDGDHYNNTLGNLTFLCPNCHSFTPTYVGHNINPSDPNKKCKTENCQNFGREKSDLCLECYDRESSKNTKQCSGLHCLELILDESTYCRSCSSKTTARKVVDRPTLVQIKLDLTELKSIKAVGRKYSVTDNTVRKWIIGYEKEIEKEKIYNETRKKEQEDI